MLGAETVSAQQCAMENKGPASVGLCRYDPLSWEYPSWASINGPAVNILKGALVASDRIVTVSQARSAHACPALHACMHILCNAFCRSTA